MGGDFSTNCFWPVKNISVVYVTCYEVGRVNLLFVRLNTDVPILHLALSRYLDTKFFEFVFQLPYLPMT